MIRIGGAAKSDRFAYWNESTSIDRICHHTNCESAAIGAIIQTCIKVNAESVYILYSRQNGILVMRVLVIIRVKSQTVIARV